MGEDTVEIAPKTGGTLTFASAKYQMKAGEIISCWKLDEKGIKYSISIPAGIKAKIVLPGKSELIECGKHEYLVPHS